MPQPLVHVTWAAALTVLRCGAAVHRRSSSKISRRMNPNPAQTQLLHRTTDILANQHSLYLLHTGQVDAHFQRSFPPLPPPPSFTVPIPSPTSSCDSAPIEPIKRAPQDSSSATPPPQPPQPKKKREPPPPLNPNADWDAWDGAADIRLVELKTDIRLRPNWNYVARRVGFSIEQCKARWEELQEEQRIQDASTRLSSSHPPSPNVPLALSPASTSPAGTPPAPLSPCFTIPPNSPARAPPATPPQQLHSAPDYSYTPSTPPPTSSAAEACAAIMQPAISEDSHPKLADDQFLGSTLCLSTQFHPISLGALPETDRRKPHARPI